MVKTIKKGHPREIIFFKLGGTWDMVNKNGRLEGLGILDDNKLKTLEEEIGYYNVNADYNALELEMSKKVDKIISESVKEFSEISSHLPWVPEIELWVRGKFISIFSGDSSQLRSSLIAPIINFLLKHAIKNPNIPILGGQGTDTADVALLPLLDTYSFDTNLPPFIITGSNRSYREKNSDAPSNFYDLIRIANKNLPSGAYWIFSGNIFKASDFVKISPLESRLVDTFSTFYSPHLKSEKIEEILKSKNNTFYKTKSIQNHVAYSSTTEKIYEALCKVHIVDLSEQNSLEQDIEKIVDLKYKAVVVAGHSFGNVSNPIKYACMRAVLKDKLVIATSRCFISDLNQRYGASLLSINSNELRGKGKRIISAHKLSKNVARAVAVRAVQEGLNQEKTEVLFNAYSISRGLSDQDIIVI